MGPLAGITIVELAGIGPAPFCGMMLADMGAEVIRIDRPTARGAITPDPLARNRKSIACDLKHPEAADSILRIVEKADGLIEGFRPGVMERLGLGPSECLARNPALAYGRVTGWGQDGPLACAAGHDINFIALSGALHMIGETDGKPVPPLNLVGDFGGGGMFLAFGMLCAILHARSTGRGQVIDAAMVDGTNAMMAMFHGFQAAGLCGNATGSSFLGGAAHFYGTYETKDGKFVALGTLEPKFYDLLISKLGIDAVEFGPHAFRWKVDGAMADHWMRLRQRLAEVFRTRTRSEWCELLEGTDACFSPVLNIDEAREHWHNKARRAFVSVGDSLQPRPAPRFSDTEPDDPRPAVPAGQNSCEILQAFEFADGEIRRLLDAEVFSQPARPGD
jgi:alpha-methylacyl-CoA racemase